MQRVALHLNEHGPASDPVGNQCLLGERALLRTCSAFSSTARLSHFKWRGVLNKQNSFLLNWKCGSADLPDEARLQDDVENKRARWFRSCGYC